MRWAFLSLTANGIALCSDIKKNLGGDIITITKRANGQTDKAFDSFEQMVRYAFEQYDCLVFVMASGIVVRSLAKLLGDKTKDPAVLVLDEKGVYCISLLSGHIGGANAYARIVAEAIGAQAVITTASDVSGKMAVDMLAQQLGCTIADMRAGKEITAMIVNGKNVMVCADTSLELPSYFTQDRIDNANSYDGIICINERSDVVLEVPFVQLVPQSVVIGIGCRKGADSDAILAFIQEEMQTLGLHMGAIDCIASVDIKAQEEGLIEAADKLDVPFRTINRDEINKVQHLFKGSDFVKETIGVSCVAQPCGYIASHHGKNLLGIKRKDGMTLSVWKMSEE